MSGRTVLITGATGGIGRATAIALAAAGARLIFAVRDTAKGAALADQLGGKHVVRALDLSDLASVRRFAQNTNEPIDTLVNNAGVASSTLQRTNDGFELQFGTNHLGHFLLTTLLLPQITARVVTVASQAERASRIDLEDLNWDHREFRGGRAYADSKLANLLFTAELDRRLRDAGSPVQAMAAHPGLVVTAIYDDPQRRRRSVWDRLLPLAGQQPDQGALPVLLAITGDLPDAAFTGPRHLMHMRGGAQVIGRSARAKDLELARRLWTASEQMAGQGAATPPTAPVQ
ncbi:SDR family NAD(P)-dependent oxidoreductase [Pseudarthrobacter sp. C4D7]|uniref:SDR family NAD(P)-dependent oxidoreductase n=1 Tax=Pseudarthrobacter sp. C4D7 TaxID=2735268 RepID=UPI0015859FF8|nr:SDR family NAD(P)-dependent oxidoreductase [Pseudarthrobacter sp. C4D7]NUT73347.1 SDR family NAD(P)-dependent oxidoreductase [Pseudarthrobacter sp. C4D7]